MFRSAALFILAAAFAANGGTGASTGEAARPPQAGGTSTAETTSNVSLRTLRLPAPLLPKDHSWAAFPGNSCRELCSFRCRTPSRAA